MDIDFGALTATAVEKLLPASMYDQVAHGWLRMGFGIKRRIRFYERMARQLESDSPLGSVRKLLSVLQMTGAGTRADARIMIRMVPRMVGGEVFRQVIEPWVPVDEHMQIDAAERAGDLGKGLEQIVELLEVRERMLKAIRAAVMYPFLVFGAIGGSLIVLSVFLVPEFREQLGNQQLKAETRSFFDTADFIATWGWLIMLAVMGLAAGVLAGMPRFCGPRSLALSRLRVRLDRYPPWSLYRSYVASAWLYALAALVQTTGEADALKRMRGALSPYLRERCEAMLKIVADGVPIGRAMRMAGFQFPDPLVIEDLASHEGKSDLGAEIMKSARRFHRETLSRVESFAVWSKYVGMVSGALVILWMADGIFSISSGITVSY
jgi:type II secretory pathway component PulF